MAANFLVFIFYVGIINYLTYLAFAKDKHFARFKVWRIKEIHLLLLALLGGTPAAFYASKKLRHKTKKRSFRIKLWFAVILQVIFLILVLAN